MATTETTDTEIRGRRYGDPSPARGLTRGPDRGRLRGGLCGRKRDRGQTAIEFLGVTPLIILLCVALWQCALIGYTFSLAGNSADEAAHQGAISEGSRGRACRHAAERGLPKVWRESMKRTTCDDSSGLYKATVKLRVPVLVPGVLNWPMTVEGNAASPLEAER
ncbi:TadE family protein [Streptomyces atratus]|uniref:TadE family protein n=1 Tax=Streptomyces atratus TaxID=1893 RepID=UPI002253A9A0|nr:TadE family protein [Streptomyces atratus]MCX5341228.1 pilus assembly protein [Streptomyces atratus]